MGAMGERGFGEVLKRYRGRAGLTQEELAEAAGLSVRGLSDLERGVSSAPRASTLHLLVEALKLSAEERAVLEAMRKHRGAADSAYEPGSRTDGPGMAPLPATALVGREQEVAAARALLLGTGAPSEPRLLTLTGPGGVGKTHLALHVAAAVRATFADGVVFVPLAAVREPHLVIPAIAEAVGLRDADDRPLHGRLRDYMGPLHLLMVLDNVEQVSEAAPEVAALLEACPALRVLATSRAALRVRGEQELPVPPLAVPAPHDVLPIEELARIPAVALLTRQARAVKPDFALTPANAATVAAICRRLDGLPLALELAAARLKVLAPQALLERLGRRLDVLTGGALDLPARQQTLRATLDWSHDLLSVDEQTLFRRFAVFAGGALLEAVETVCYPAGELAAGAALDGVAGLVDKSLLRQEEQPDGTTRFAMLESIREYAAERLSAGDDAAALRRAHAMYALAVAEEAERELAGPRQDVWLARLSVEHDNLRAALGWAREHAEGEIGLRLAVALSPFWQTRGYLGEGRTWLAGLLAELSAPPTVRARALVAASTLAYLQGAFATATALAEEGLALARSLGDAHGIAGALNALGVVASQRGDATQATTLFEESLSLHRALDDRAGVAVALDYLGLLARYSGEFARARTLYTQCLALRRRAGDRRGEAAVLMSLGIVDREQGRCAQAAALLDESLALYRRRADDWGVAAVLNHQALVAAYEGDSSRALALTDESLTLHRRLDNQWGIAFSLSILGRVARARGEAPHAEQLLRESLALWRTLGDRRQLAATLRELGYVARMQARQADAGALFVESLDLYQSMGATVGIALCLEGLGALAGEQGRPWDAAGAFGAAAALRARCGTPFPLADQPAHERDVAVVRALLGDDRFAQAWAAGQARPVEEVIASISGGAAGGDLAARVPAAPVHTADAPPPRADR